MNKRIMFFLFVVFLQLSGDQIVRQYDFEKYLGWYSPSYWNGKLSASTDAKNGKKAARLLSENKKGRIFGRMVSYDLHSQYSLRPDIDCAGKKFKIRYYAKGKGELAVGMMISTIQDKSRKTGKLSYTFLYDDKRMTLSNQWQPGEGLIDLTAKSPSTMSMIFEIQGEGEALIDDVALIDLEESSATPQVRLKGQIIIAERDLIPQLDFSTASPESRGTILVSGPDHPMRQFPVISDKQGRVNWKGGKHCGIGLNLVTLSMGGNTCKSYVSVLPDLEWRLMDDMARNIPRSKTEGTRNILWLGDSICDFSRGYNAVDKLSYWLNKYQADTWHIENRAVRGDYILRLEKRLLGQNCFERHAYEGMWKKEYDLIVIQLGNNDNVSSSKTNYTAAQVSPRQALAAYERVCKIIRRHSQAKLLLTSATYANMPKQMAEIHRSGSNTNYAFGLEKFVLPFNKIIQEFAERTNSSYLDLHTPMKKRYNEKNYYDGIHLNEKGHHVLTEILLQQFANIPEAKKEAWSSSNPARAAGTSFANAVWRESFLTDDLPLKVEYFDGAEGSVKLVPGAGRSGGAALRTTKTTNAGYMVVRFNRHITVKQGDKIQLNGFYQSLNFHPRYSLAMLRLQVPGQKDFRRYHYAGHGGDRLQEVVGTPNKTWERKFNQRQAAKGISRFEPVIVISGAASQILWDDFYAEDGNISIDNWTTNLNKRPPLDRSSQMLSLETLDEKLSKEVEHTGKVVNIDGKSRLLVDGKITCPIINAPYSRYVVGKTYSNNQEFAQAGIHLVNVGFSLGRGRQGSSGCWTSEHELEVSGAADMIRRPLRLDPDARIVLSIGLKPYWQFTRDYPDEAWIVEQGFPLYGGDCHVMEVPAPKPSNPQHYIWPSYQSEKLIALYKLQIQKIVTELKNTGLSKMIVGLHIHGGHDNQMTVVHFDYSQPSVRAFRRYLRQKYGTEQALQKSWQNHTVTFENAVPPKYQSTRDCLDPVKERAQIDFFHYNKTAAWRMVDGITQYTKKLFDKEMFTIRWCQGPYDAGMVTTLDIQDFLRNQKFDILVAQASYNLRPPSAVCLPRIPLASFHLNNKLFIHEFDLRTWNAAPSWESETLSIGWGLLLDPPMWCASNRKLSGSMFAHDMGHWYLDMAPGWFDHPEIMADIKEVAETGQGLSTESPSGWKPDSAFIVDDEGMFLFNLPSIKWKFDIRSLVGDQNILLGNASVPFQFYCLKDLLERPELASKFKVLVFGGMLNIDSSRRQFLNSLKNNNRTLIFLSGTGRLSNVESDTGFKLGLDKPQVNHEVVAEPGVKINMDSFWMTYRKTKQNSPPDWYEYISIIHALPKKGDRVLARFAANGQAAVVEHQYKGWKAVYIGEAGGLTPEYFNHLVREAGGYYLTDSGFQCETNGNFMSVHCLRSQKTTFRMPYRADVKNLYNGQIHENVIQIPIDAEAGSTYWFSLKPAGK